MAKGKKKGKSKARPKKTKKKQKSFLLFPKFFQKWSLIFIGLFALLGLLASLNFPKLTMEKNMTSTDERTVAFIAEIGETSRYLAARNDLYASVMIAQAILESDSGQSTLSQKPSYNFFGIKGDYNGQSVTLPTWEDDGKGNPYYIDAAFRSYGSVENSDFFMLLSFCCDLYFMMSLQDYVDFLEGSYYVGVHRSNTKNYKDATAALTGVYATDTTYGDKLNSIIEQYQLTIYDTY